MPVRKNKLGTRKRRFGDNIQQPKSSSSNEFYDSAASVGKGFAYIKAVVGGIIALALIFGGFKVRKTVNYYTEQVQLTVKEVKQIISGNDKNGQPIIDYNLTGTVPNCGTDLITVRNYRENISVGQVITVWMRKNCVGPDAVMSPTNYKTIGNVMIGIGFIIILLVALNIYFIRKYKAYAAVHGAGSMLGMVSSGFDGNY